jgi:uncharacterized protein YndB with AHSA1/START domain
MSRRRRKRCGPRSRQASTPSTSGTATCVQIGSKDPEDQNKLSHDGEVIEIDPPNRLVMTFDMKPEGLLEAPSRVTYELADHEGATKLTVIHDNFPPNTDVLHRISGGWPRILSGMKTYIESGKLG